MKHILILAAAVLTACQAGPETSNKMLQSFADLLKVTDNSDAPICTLPVLDIKDSMSAEAWEAQSAKAYDIEAYIAENPDDLAAQIKVILRRAALKRRLNVDSDETAPATKYYNALEDRSKNVSTLTQVHDGFHYYMDRISEQGEHGTAESPEFNLRFCVLNEYRAKLHSASRADIIARIQAGAALPNPELIENINHEGIYGDAFRAEMFAQLFKPDAIKNMSPLDMAKMRGDKSIFPFDPKTAEAFWTARDIEIEAYLKYIQTEGFDRPADKLKNMTDIDQSLRKLLSGEGAQNHFESSTEYGVFKSGIYSRLTKVDKFNTAELERMLEGRGWFTDADGVGAGNNAWLIAQHADRNPDFQINALKMIEAELDSPGVSKSNYAYLYDRVQMRFTDGDVDRRVQRYGTQGRCTGPGLWEPLPVEEPDRLDEVRAEVGLGTMAEYEARFKDICTEDQR